MSPFLYLAEISSLSASLLSRSGFAFTYISRRVATVALCREPRTPARHEGHVNMGAPGGGGVGAESWAEAWKANQSFRQAPQKVWRQSRRVRGW